MVDMYLEIHFREYGFKEGANRYNRDNDWGYFCNDCLSNLNLGGRCAENETIVGDFECSWNATEHCCTHGVYFENRRHDIIIGDFKIEKVRSQLIEFHVNFGKRDDDNQSADLTFFYSVNAIKSQFKTLQNKRKIQNISEVLGAFRTWWSNDQINLNGVIPHTQDNRLAMNEIFKFICIDSSYVSNCENTFKISDPCIGLEQSELKGHCNWWFDKASFISDKEKGDILYSDFDHLITIGTFRDLCRSSPVVNCDSRLIKLCNTKTPVERATKYRNLCGCMNQTDIDTYYSLVDSISPELSAYIKTQNKIPECGYPPCSSPSSIKPFNNRTMTCPDDKSCVIISDFKNNSTINANNITIKNDVSCFGGTSPTINCGSGVLTYSENKSHMACCPKNSYSILNESNNCVCNEGTEYDSEKNICRKQSSPPLPVFKTSTLSVSIALFCFVVLLYIIMLKRIVKI
jgi:hypothetical protein